ncbi:uncharacterized protein LOC132306910 [Cornus florida]|uniref:uncharacterized protein LOC132306910 n=1 Tax=Cornus florida TaxID=4283 RepID=UPI00289B6788|nr:uncharacterized protein LOC132306910 [Cornus florida]
METLVVVAHHRNHYYSRRRAHGLARFGSFESPPSRYFREISCRTFQSGVGILPIPLKGYTSPLTKQACSFSSPKTTSPSVSSHSNDVRRLKRSVRSSVVPIPISFRDGDNKEGSLSDDFSYSELWAGPAYSNSPPPSSLPIPKFSVRSNRTASLDLPSSEFDSNFRPITKSAPPSPTREHDPSPINLFQGVDSATEALRRILNLDISDE